MPQISGKHPMELVMPLWLIKLLLYPFLIGWLLVFILFMPVALLHRWTLCVIAWIAWIKPGREVIVVHSGTSAASQEWMSQILPLVDGKALILDYDERQTWDRRSLVVRLFYSFGPIPIPPMFLPYRLPAVVVFRKFRWPKAFAFGRRTPGIDPPLQDLASYLTEDKRGNRED